MARSTLGILCYSYTGPTDGGRLAHARTWWRGGHPAYLQSRTNDCAPRHFTHREATAVLISPRLYLHNYKPKDL